MVGIAMSSDEVVFNFFKNYRDRGMKKWSGFFLSDHISKINQADKEETQSYPAKSRMSEHEISQILLKSFSNHLLVRLQLKLVDEDGNYLPDIEGFVLGCTDDKILIDNQMISLADINHIENIDIKK
ncbi:hypothetical protein [Lactobacillus psittaci]|uniref:DNA-directed RNA polymerase beta subunit n=1 Tax=Lactobacillus psittaci DSM 15354 TaxID=1122152 RepID=A0A0R1S2U6_9LACO|nr:hypothetical protein [Lactobacillus psittaci]KRL63281.1 hypothetical protein FC23_GL000851 [Lactobacillus psittaci DSM 15354]